MIGVLITAVALPLIGLAVSRLIGRVQPFLAGAGVVGCWVFYTGLLQIPIRAAVIALALSVLFIFLTRQSSVGVPHAYPAIPTLLVFIAAAWLLTLATILPLNDYDGRAFWVLKAKAIAFEDGIDGPFFHQQTSASPRNQYPLLLPCTAAVHLLLSRSLDDRQVRWFYAAFAIAFALEIRTRFGALFSSSVGAWSAATFLCLPQILVASEGGALSAYADIALGAFVGCAFFELVEAESPLRVGMWSSFVVLTKSEGLPLAILLLLMAAVVFRRRVAAAMIPVALAVSLLLVWRSHVPRSDERDFARLILMLPLHWARFRTSLADLGHQVVSFRDWGILGPVFVAAVVMLLVQRRWRPVLLAIPLVLPMLTLYAAAYAVTEWDQGALRQYLAPRVVTHLLGPVLYVIGAAAACIESLAQANRQSASAAPRAGGPARPAAETSSAPSAR